MRCLLDTNTVIFALRNRPSPVRIRLLETSPDEVIVSTITLGELWYGAEKSSEPERRRTQLVAFLEPYQVLSFDRSAAERYGVLRHDLRHSPIGERDLLIAATAIVNEACVVTHNTREFSRVPGLEVQDWTGDL
jgi:tRNA(fMet)-specific endonuclease VapC